MSPFSVPKLFQPIKIGTQTLQHRVVLAPLTRFRSTKKEHVPVVPLVKTYYSQRGSRPGTLLITEATFIAPQAGGFDNVPGIWNKDQISAWKEVTDAVHANGSFIYLQLWALGRAATSSVLAHDSLSYVAPSAVPLTSQADSIPRPLTASEVKEYVSLYAQAAKNAVFEAGFDGVEIHGANGYLIDQFIQDVSNKRTDDYGGSIENRSRFALEVVEAVSKSIGEERTGIRLSPWSEFQDMKMANPVPQYSHLVSTIKTSFPSLAYIHLVEPEIGGNVGKIHESAETGNDTVEQSNDFIRTIWRPKPLITAGGYTRESAILRAEEKGELIAFGRYFISNPDISLRLEKNIPLTTYNRNTFYTPAEKPSTEIGYIDYPFATGADGQIAGLEKVKENLVRL